MRGKTVSERKGPLVMLSMRHIRRELYLCFFAIASIEIAYHWFVYLFEDSLGIRSEQKTRWNVSRLPLLRREMKSEEVITEEGKDGEGGEETLPQSELMKCV